MEKIVKIQNKEKVVLVRYIEQREALVFIKPLTKTVHKQRAIEGYMGGDHNSAVTL